MAISPNQSATQKLPRREVIDYQELAEPVGRATWGISVEDVALNHSGETHDLNIVTFNPNTGRGGDGTLFVMADGVDVPLQAIKASYPWSASFRIKDAVVKREKDGQLKEIVVRGHNLGGGVFKYSLDADLLKSRIREAQDFDWERHTTTGDESFNDLLPAKWQEISAFRVFNKSDGMFRTALCTPDHAIQEGMEIWVPSEKAEPAE